MSFNTARQGPPNHIINNFQHNNWLVQSKVIEIAKNVQEKGSKPARFAIIPDVVCLEYL